MWTTTLESLSWGALLLSVSFLALASGRLIGSCVRLTRTLKRFGKDVTTSPVTIRASMPALQSQRGFSKINQPNHLYR